ncbi:hypothetical protein [Henriciella sp.]|uniref:hypothetical protein n=1 Tax=Henriciella sp. TaxID=1968823 RepID=UPI002623D9CB|nr:hypothetical protein [Henriciella sp.]
MIRRTIAVLGLASLTLAGGCQTQPDPCTPEWIEWKTDRVLSRFAQANMDTVRALRDVPDSPANSSAVTALRIATLMGDFTDLAEDFDRIVMPELNDAVALCGEPRNFVPAFSQFLRNEGVSEDVIGWIEVIGYLSAGTRS